MPLNIKNSEVERLIEEISRLTGETKTESVRKALEERRARIAYRIADKSAERLKRFLQQEVWPQVPKSQRKRKITREEEEAILGYGKQGI